MQVRVLKFVLLGVLLAVVCLPAPAPAHAQANAKANAKEPFLVQAVPLAQKSQRETAVPASVTLAQAMWETGRGDHPIGDANNYFGIKAAGTTDADVNVGTVAIGWVWASTKEWNGARYVTSRERFRQYRSMEDSFLDHGLLLATAPRYANAMLAVDDPREFARRIAAAGYATSPTYARDLISVMDGDNLYQYDLPRNAFELVAQSETVQVNAGDIFQIYLELKNTGFGTWSPTADYHLESVNGNRFGAATRQELGQVVQPNRAKRWALTMFAPKQAGSYTTIWQLKHGTRDIGAPIRVQVEVRSADAAPNLWLPGGIGLVVAVGVLGLSQVWVRRRQQKTPRSRFR